MIYHKKTVSKFCLITSYAYLYTSLVPPTFFLLILSIPRSQTTVQTMNQQDLSTSSNLSRTPSRYRTKPKRNNILPAPIPPPNPDIPAPISLGYVNHVNNLPPAAPAVPPLPTSIQNVEELYPQPSSMVTPPDSPKRQPTEKSPYTPRPPASPPSEPCSDPSEVVEPTPKLTRSFSFGRTFSLKRQGSKSSSSLEIRPNNSSSSDLSTPAASMPKVPQLPPDYHSITFHVGKKTTVEQLSVNQPALVVLKWLVSQEPKGANTDNRFRLDSSDPDDYMFWEVCASLGLRRPIRPTEYLKNVVDSWPKQSTNYYLEIGSSDARLDIASCASLCPRRDILSSGPTGPTFHAEMYHQVSPPSGLRSATWKKVMVDVNDFELKLYCSKYKRAVGIPDSDLYEVSAHMSKSSPGKYILGLRSQKSPDMFENPRQDCMQILATNSGTTYNNLRNVVFSLRNQTVDKQSRDLRLSLESVSRTSSNESASANTSAKQDQEIPNTTNRSRSVRRMRPDPSTKKTSPTPTMTNTSDKNQSPHMQTHGALPASLLSQVTQMQLQQKVPAQSQPLFQADSLLAKQAVRSQSSSHNGHLHPQTLNPQSCFKPTGLLGRAM